MSPYRVLVGETPAVDDLEEEVDLPADELVRGVDEHVILLLVLLPLGVARGYLHLPASKKERERHIRKAREKDMIDARH